MKNFRRLPRQSRLANCLCALPLAALLAACGGGDAPVRELAKAGPAAPGLALLDTQFDSAEDMAAWEGSLVWSSTYPTSDMSWDPAGTMNLAMSATDTGGWVLSPTFPASKRLKAMVTLKMHAGNEYFLPRIMLTDETSAPATHTGPNHHVIIVGLVRSQHPTDYACSAFDRPYVLDNLGCAATLHQDLSKSSSSLYDRWITTTVEYDARTGIVAVDYESDGVVDLKAQVNAGARIEPTRIALSHYGWYTGHTVKVDAVRVEKGTGTL